jgi:hypothetical protein
MSDEKLGKYGHHPHPAVDAEVEAERLEGLLCEAWSASGLHPAAAALELHERLASVAPMVEVALPGGSTAVVPAWKLRRPPGSDPKRGGG